MSVEARHSVPAASGQAGRAGSATQVELADLLGLRSRAGKPVAQSARRQAATAGSHVSTLRGRGMDYAESRMYQAGDDARNIDWRRTARSGKWHTKLFEAERRQDLLLLVDTHATMRFGTRVRYKSVAAARAAAWLAWTSLRGGDRTGALAFGPVRGACDPRAGTRGVLAVLGALVHWDAEARAIPGAGEGEALSVALRRARGWLAPGGRAWLLSDGWCADDGAAAALVSLARHAELRVVVVEDALERELPPAGCYAFETGPVTQRVDLGAAAARAQFLEQLARGQQRLAAACREAGVACAALATDDDPVACLDALRRTWGRPA